MPDETTPARGSGDLDSELAQSRETAARLMDNLARKIGASRRVRQAATRVRRAANFVQDHEWKGVAAGIGKAVGGRPAAWIVAAVVAGFLLGRALRTR